MVGDLAQFMVQNDLDDKKLVEKAGSLNLPGRSVFFLLQMPDTRLRQNKDLKQKKQSVFCQVKLFLFQ